MSGDTRGSPEEKGGWATSMGIHTGGGGCAHATRDQAVSVMHKQAVERHALVAKVGTTRAHPQEQRASGGKEERRANRAHTRFITGMRQTDIEHAPAVHWGGGGHPCNQVTNNTQALTPQLKAIGHGTVEEKKTKPPNINSIHCVTTTQKFCKYQRCASLGQLP